ncbi:hypothetical protein MKY04_13510 [Lysinibacillus telephonicus]|uniref:hypothetical protein n=1 Tax=Lysinibacillus telephonicus TaxID=1714840 RepID=UPI0031FCF9D3
MKICDIWKKIISAQTYSKEVCETRVNTIYTVGQLSDPEYTELITLINSTYGSTKS